MPDSYNTNIEHLMSAAVKSGYNSEGYNKKYRSLQKLTAFEKKCIDQFLEKCSASPKILDLGCGAAITYDPYIISKGRQLTGVDLSPNQIELAKCNCPEGTFFCDDMFSFPIGSDFDGIVMFYSLFHMYRERHREFLARIYREISPSTSILLNIYTKDSGEFKYKENFCGTPMYWSNYSKSDFLLILEDIGFQYEDLGNEQDYGSSESHSWLLLWK